MQSGLKVLHELVSLKHEKWMQRKCLTSIWNLVHGYQLCCAQVLIESSLGCSGDFVLWVVWHFYQEYISCEFSRYFYFLLIHPLPTLLDIFLIWTRKFLAFKNNFQKEFNWQKNKPDIHTHMTNVTWKVAIYAKYILLISISIYCVWIVQPH